MFETFFIAVLCWLACCTKSRSEKERTDMNASPLTQSEIDSATNEHSAATQAGPQPQSPDEVRAAVDTGDMEVVRLDEHRTTVVFVSPDGL